MVVYIVTKSWCPDNNVETLEAWDGFQKIVGVYADEEKARAVQEELIGTDLQDYLCGAIEHQMDVCIEKHEVR